MSAGDWTLADAPRLDGRVALVTGSTGGLGTETALGLARLGAEVIVSGRNAQRGAAALGLIRQAVPTAKVAFEMLDLASLASVKGFATRRGTAALDILVNNAAVMALPVRSTTADGFETQFGTNYLGHVALTAALMPALLRSRFGSRVVNLASLAHRKGRIAFDDLQGERRYDGWTAYRQSKLAMLMFARALQRRATERGWPLRSIAAHPGWALTQIIRNGPGRSDPAWKIALMQLVFGLMGQSAEAGARPILFAATAPEAEPGGYYGPTGSGERKGPVGPSVVEAQALDLDAEERLWAVSTELTGARWP